MKFDDLDKKLRVYETIHDVSVLPEMYMVARIDGRSFTRLTKDVHKFQAPFDEKFRDYMIETVKHLMNCGFKVIYGYTESDEISLLFYFKENAFSRKHRKYNSILAGEASAKFTSMLGTIASFDCRICEFPNRQLVVDYFRWRNEDAHRNALNAHCYWRLRSDNFSQTEATKKLERLSTADKNELLFNYGTNFNEVPAWQKRGIGIYWKTTERQGYNPKLEEEMIVSRKELTVDFNLAMRDEYDQFVLKIINSNEQSEKD